jgi:hypothetical protein
MDGLAAGDDAWVRLAAGIGFAGFDSAAGWTFEGAADFSAILLVFFEVLVDSIFWYFIALNQFCRYLFQHGYFA